MAKLLDVKDLSIAFGGLKAVDSLSFDINEKEVFGLIGPNGAGKTTVFNCITQFYKADSGVLEFKNNQGNIVNLENLHVHDVIHHGIVRTFQNVELVRELTILQNVMIGGQIKFRSNLLDVFFNTRRLRKEERELEDRAIEVLTKLNLDHLMYQPAGGQPYGVQKKVELARTLMLNPKLIILDEPAAGLNDKETAELADTIKLISREMDCAIMLVEHDMGLVMKICDRICAISFGKKLAIGTPSEIQANKKVQEAYLGVAEEELEEELEETIHKDDVTNEVRNITQDMLDEVSNEK